jgi:hypothetical protein
LPADDVAAALWHPLKAFSAPFYGSAGFISSCSAHICTQKVHKDSLSGPTIFFYCFAMWATSSGIKQTQNVYMYKNKTHDDGRTSKTGTCRYRKKNGQR